MKLAFWLAIGCGAIAFLCFSSYLSDRKHGDPYGLGQMSSGCAFIGFTLLGVLFALCGVFA